MPRFSSEKRQKQEMSLLDSDNVFAGAIPAS